MKLAIRSFQETERVQTMRAKLFVIAFAVVVLAVDSTSSGRPAPSSPSQQPVPLDHSKPNIVFILSDNVGYGVLSSYNGGILDTPTPRIDKLAAEGLRLTKTVSPPVQAAGPWSGDFDGALKRHYLRALVASSKTQYCVINGVQHGSSYEFLHEFEEWVNHKYPPKEKNLRFHVVFVPVSHDQILARLTGGRGDLAVGTLTITPERLKVVDTRALGLMG
jgi:hypothetical protein